MPWNSLNPRHRKFASHNRQSARLFLQSSELGLPHPHTRRRVCPPPLHWLEGYTLACGEGVGGPNSDEGTDTVVPSIACEYVLSDLHHGRRISIDEQWTLYILCRWIWLPSPPPPPVCFPFFVLSSLFVAGSDFAYILAALGGFHGAGGVLEKLTNQFRKMHLRILKPVCAK
jgi:hypothetical protein